MRTVALNKKEQSVLDSFDGTKAITLAELAAKSFAKKGTAPKTKGNSWVRNSMRKLLKLGLVEYVAGEAKGSKTGTYKRTKKTLAAVLKEANKGTKETPAAEA